MQGKILGLLAETHVHPGSGQSEGAIDLPVARERTTDFPFVPGSGVKGALKDLAIRTAWAAIASSDGSAGQLLDQALDAVGLGEGAAQQSSAIGTLRKWAKQRVEGRNRRRDGESDDERIERERRLCAEIAGEACYGVADSAGDLVIGDAKLLLLPVRSLTGAYRWLTCPYLIERFQRDRKRCGGSDGGVDTDSLRHAVGDDHKVLVEKQAGGKDLFLEERVFAQTPDATQAGKIVTLVSPLVAHDEARKRLAGQLAVVSDDAFAWFARYALPVHARNVLDENKTSTNLWYEESLAPDTLLYALAFEHKAGVLGHLGALFDETKGGRPWLQLGGNETIGQGWLKVALVPGDAP